MPEGTNNRVNGLSPHIRLIDADDPEELDPWIKRQDEDYKVYALENGRSQTVEMQGVPNGQNGHPNQHHHPNGTVTDTDTAMEVRNAPAVMYKVDDVPPWYLCVIFGLQHYLTMFGGTISYPYILTPKLCMRDDDPARGYIISTTFFVSGIVTFIQATFGVRLPIIQGSTFSFLIPTLAILNLPQWRCPSEEQMIAARPMSMLGNNNTHNGTDYPVTEEEWTALWQSRILEIQGAVIVASLFEVFIGFTGLMGILLKWIGPIGVTPIITLIGLSLFEDAAHAAGKHWGVAAMTMIMLIVFSEYLKEIQVPGFYFSTTRGIIFTKFPLFKLFPVLLTIILSWLICVVLTESGAFHDSSLARTDIRLAALDNSPWIRVPYPGQWGLPTVSAGAVFGIMAGVVSSAIESVGDYFACARMAGAPPPPTHAVNRGIFLEGIGCVLSGIFGSGNGLTSYSENIGAIGVTKVGSRRVIQYGAILMIFFGVLSKFGALFVTMPEPILGGIFCVMFAVITGVGLSNLQFIDLNSSRNLFVLGTAIFMGLMIPNFMKANPNAIQTGSPIMDQIITILLTTSLFVGGIIGIFMDNTIPGTDEERGIKKWREDELTSGKMSTEKSRAFVNKCYDFPVGMGFIRRFQIFKYFPISPTFDSELVNRKFKQIFHKICPWCKKDNELSREEINVSTQSNSTKV